MINIDIVILENKPGNGCSIFIRIHLKYSVNYSKICCIALNACIPDCYRGKTFHLFNTESGVAAKLLENSFFYKNKVFSFMLYSFSTKIYRVKSFILFFFIKIRFIIFPSKFNLFYLDRCVYHSIQY